jgi:hypothetical protein
MVKVQSADVMSLHRKIARWIDKGTIETCPGCGALNSPYFEGCERYSFRGDPMFHDEKYTLYFGGGFDGMFGGECGHCLNSFMPVDSPINSECYTHNAPDSD